MLQLYNLALSLHHDRYTIKTTLLALLHVVHMHAAQ